MLWFYTSKSKSSLLNLNLILLIFMMMTKTTSAEEQNNFYHKSAGKCKNVKITKFWDDEESVWASEGRWRESQSKENTNNWMMRGFLFLSVFHFLFWNTEWQEWKRGRDGKQRGSREIGKLSGKLASQLFASSAWMLQKLSVDPVDMWLYTLKHTRCLWKNHFNPLKT